MYIISILIVVRGSMYIYGCGIDSIKSYGISKALKVFSANPWSCLMNLIQFWLENKFLNFFKQSINYRSFFLIIEGKSNKGNSTYIFEGGGLSFHIEIYRIIILLYIYIKYLHIFNYIFTFIFNCIFKNLSELVRIKLNTNFLS